MICCVTSDRTNAPGVIAKDFIRIFYNHLRSLGKVKRVDVFIFTSGGDTLAAFGISRLLREFAPDDVGALVPEQCHSAGTLLILGANEIFMTPAATLSPIDPSVQTPLNPKIEGLMPGMPPSRFPVSVENIAGFKDLTEQEWRLGNVGKAAAFGFLAKEVHPLVLGQAYRTRQQIGRLAEVLLRNHRTDAKNIRHIVEQLTHQLGSHDYLISRKEAKEILGKQVVDDGDRKLETAVWDLHEDFQKEMELGRVFDPVAALQQEIARGTRPPVTITNRLVTIETTAATDVWQSEMRLTPVQMPGPQLPGGVGAGIQQTVVYNGWRHYE